MTYYEWMKQQPGAPTAPGYVGWYAQTAWGPLLPEMQINFNVTWPAAFEAIKAATAGLSPKITRRMDFFGLPITKPPVLLVNSKLVVDENSQTGPDPREWYEITLPSGLKASAGMLWHDACLFARAVEPVLEGKVIFLEAEGQFVPAWKPEPTAPPANIPGQTLEQENAMLKALLNQLRAELDALKAGR